jgi:hypothetical protein
VKGWFVLVVAAGAGLAEVLLELGLLLRIRFMSGRP